MTSIRRLTTNSVALILSIFVFATISPVAAQTSQPNSLIVRAFENVAGSQTPKTYLLRVSPDKSESFDLAFDETATQLLLSPDGQWIATTKTDPNSNTILSYAKRGQPATEISIPAASSLILPTFSSDSKYLAYSIGNFDQDMWELHIIDLSNGSQRVLGGKMSETVGAPSIVGWNPDGKHVYTLPIYMEGPSSGSPTEIDLSAVPAGDTPQPMPAGKLLLEDKYVHMLVQSTFSNDASKLVFSFHDDARPVPNWMGPGNPNNTIGLYDAASGTSKIIFEAPKDEAVLNPMWSGDGTKLLWQAGAYTLDETTGSSDLASPKLYVYDVATGKVSDGVSIAVAPTESAYLLSVCGDTLYYMVSGKQPDTQKTALYGVPLSDLTNQGRPLHTVTGGYRELECIAQ